jgi:hypothetical protein
MIRFNWSTLKQSRWYEFVVRFALGGLATSFAGLVANVYGPAVGGLFLAFPAIFCAGATMIETHERRRKRAKGMQGNRRGRQAAALDAAGTVYGSAGLVAFALIVSVFSGTLPFSLVLILASASWAAISIILWRGQRAWNHF